MKKSIIILLLFVYVASATELHELFKFPVMLEHYKEHKQKNNLISFVDFLNMHYSDVQNDDGDREKDKQLPFKSHPHTETINNNLVTAFTDQSYTIQPAEICIHLVSFKHLQIFPSSFQGNIWQPPKFC